MMIFQIHVYTLNTFPIFRNICALAEIYHVCEYVSHCEAIHMCLSTVYASASANSPAYKTTYITNLICLDHSLQVLLDMELLRRAKLH